MHVFVLIYLVILCITAFYIFSATFRGLPSSLPTSFFLDKFRNLVRRFKCASEKRVSYCDAEYLFPHHETYGNPIKDAMAKAILTFRHTEHSSLEIKSVLILRNLAVTGGREVSLNIGKFMLPDIAHKLVDPSVCLELKIACLDTVSSLCAFCCKENQDLVRKYGILVVILDGVRPHQTYLQLLYRMWCAHALFYATVDNDLNTRLLLRYNIKPDLHNLSFFMSPKNTMWEFNDAEMVLQMITSKATGKPQVLSTSGKHVSFA